MTFFISRGILYKPHIVGYKCAHRVPPISSETLFKAGARKMYAIIVTGGKQYRVENGDVIYVEKLDVNEEETVSFDKVIALSPDKGAMKVGKPYVKNAVVTGKVLKNGKGKKITVFTYKPKKGSARKMGHRQPYTKVQIENIEIVAE